MKFEPTELVDYSETGEDRTLIRWFLSLSASDRLQVLDDYLDFFSMVDAKRNPTNA